MTRSLLRCGCQELAACSRLNDNVLDPGETSRRPRGDGLGYTCTVSQLGQHVRGEESRNRARPRGDPNSRTDHLPAAGAPGGLISATDREASALGMTWQKQENSAAPRGPRVARGRPPREQPSAGTQKSSGRNTLSPRGQAQRTQQDKPSHKLEQKRGTRNPGVRRDKRRLGHSSPSAMSWLGTLQAYSCR